MPQKIDGLAVWNFVLSLEELEALGNETGGQREDLIWRWLDDRPADFHSLSPQQKIRWYRRDRLKLADRKEAEKREQFHRIYTNLVLYSTEAEKWLESRGVDSLPLLTWWDKSAMRFSQIPLLRALFRQANIRGLNGAGAKRVQAEQAEGAGRHKKKSVDALATPTPRLTSALLMLGRLANIRPTNRWPAS